MSENCMHAQFTVNGETVDAQVPVRMHLVDYLREEMGLTGSHLGCEHGVCGACTVLIDGTAVRSCLMLAVQAEGEDIITIEGIGGSGERAGEGMTMPEMLDVIAQLLVAGNETTTKLIAAANPFVAAMVRFEHHGRGNFGTSA